MPISIASFNAQLMAIIGSNAAITDIVGTRFYYNRLPQLDSFPALTWNVINVSPVEQKIGVSAYDIVRVQFDCYDLPETTEGGVNQVEALYDAIRTTFDRFTNDSGVVEFHFTKFKNRTQMTQDFDTKIYTVNVDFDFHIK